MKHIIYGNKHFMDTSLIFSAKIIAIKLYRDLSVFFDPDAVI